MLEKNIKTTVVIIGAGPSGSVAASLLLQKGYDVVIIEKAEFPRFSIGESLLPQCMEYLKEADMLGVIAEEKSFQHKNGAAFHNNSDAATIDFSQKFTSGISATYQVRRDKFDKILADRSQELGAKIYYKTAVLAIKDTDKYTELTVENLDNNRQYTIQADFVLDASGFGRVLPKLLDLEKPSDFPIRQSFFCHVQDNIAEPSFDRDKILISVHPTRKDVWYWLIPFADGISSIGVVAKTEVFSNYSNHSNQEVLDDFIKQMPYLSKVLLNAKTVNEVQTIKGYSANVSKLYGERFALLGNAAEFLDPVFSSGITIAVKSASLAVAVLDKKLKGEPVDWDKEFVKPLYVGVNTFRNFVDAWYDGSLQDIIFYKDGLYSVQSMIIAILAGYAWDETNPFVKHGKRRLKALSEICK